MNPIPTITRGLRILLGLPLQDEIIPSEFKSIKPTFSESGFKRGFEQYDSPLATASGSFATASRKYKLPDPYLPAVLGLMETSGGKYQKFANNPFNWGRQDLPSLPYAIDRIYSGIGGRFGQYKPYLQSGNLADFFKVYTPSGEGNPSIEELIARYNSLRKLFGETR